MANRSYLYSVDVIPEPGKEPPVIRGLSEIDKDIPLAHLILAGAQPRVCQSVIWTEQQIAVVGDFAPGMSRLIQLLNVLAHTSLVGDPTFMGALAQTVTTLSNPTFRGKFFLLEAGEIFDMSGEELEVSVSNLVQKQIPETNQKVQDALLGKGGAWLSELAKTWRESLGLVWSDVLYYDFSKKDQK